MAEAAGQAALLRLMAWLSPAFPVGAFAYSHGLERAVHDGLVADRDSLSDWIEALITHGSGWNDAVLAAESRRRAAEGGDLAELAALGEALAGSGERHMETMLQGTAFLEAARQWPAPGLASLPSRAPYPVAVGAVSGVHSIAAEPMLAALVQAFATNLVQAAIRLSVVGQQQAVAIVAALEPAITAAAARAARSDLDDLGAASFTADIMAMRHEEQHVRLFRS